MSQLLRTLQDYRNIASHLHGERSPATKKLDEKIKEHGSDAVVKKSEREMMYFIMNFERAEPGTISTDFV